jgi:aspartate-semialdehyde dehydrogenase
VPLIVPEINGELAPVLGNDHPGGIIANPNCSTIQIVMAVAPLDRVFGVREAHVTTLQAVSGAGQAAVDELGRQDGMAQAAPPGDIFPRSISHNVIPAIGSALDDGSFEEEAKVVREMRKILGRAGDLAVSCTATRVPVVTGHSAAIRLICDQDVDLEKAHEALASWPGIGVSLGPHGYLTPREIAGLPTVAVGRLRRDPDNPKALLLWVVADNLMKGAAWNAVQIAGRLAGAGPQ